MIGRERRMLLRHYLEQGVSKSALARQVGISRDTIHRWIRDGDLDRDLDGGGVGTGRGRGYRRSSMRTRGSLRPGWLRFQSFRRFDCWRRSGPRGMAVATRS